MVEVDVMSQGAPKFFKRQSGQMKAVADDVQEILEATKQLSEKVKTEPPPPPVVTKRVPPGSGVYKMVIPTRPPRVEKVKDEPEEG